MNETGKKPTRSQVARYVEENFSSSNELLNWTLPDWTENPSILKRIHETKYREWARALNGVWKELARKINPEVAKHPERHSLIYVQNGFIVPGGRFKGKEGNKKRICKISEKTHRSTNNHRSFSYENSTLAIKRSNFNFWLHS